MTCHRCGSVRILHVNGKCSDRFAMWQNGKEYLDYVPDDIGIGGGDEMVFHYCLECGQIQGKFPLPNPNFEEEE